MLLRTSSAPVLKTLLANPEAAAAAAEIGGGCGCAKLLLSPATMCLKRTSSEGEKMFLNCMNSPVGVSPVVKEREGSCMGRTASSLVEWEIERMACEGGGVGGGSGGGVLGGGGGGDGSWDSGQWPKGSWSMEQYYQNMIETYPGDGLLLANYAKFLKEVGGKAEKAEELCERAMLADARDGDVLSMYGDLIWNNHRDSVRAQSYFDQALQTSPDDCHVLASYARFLWDVEEEEEEAEGGGGKEDATKKESDQLATTCASLNIIPQGYPHFAAAS